MQIVPAMLIGLLFGTGILIAGMANPAKVLNFFDVAGTWDPSLGLVMGAALAVTAIGYRFVLARRRPMLAPEFSLPNASHIHVSLLSGSAVFGVGWGLSGFCPGGVIPILGVGLTKPLIFFAGLALGIIAARLYRTWAQSKPTRAPVT